MVTWYLVHYCLSDGSEANVTLNRTESSHTFIERNAGQRVYTVSVQALSEHLPSAIVGPVTARGQWLDRKLYSYLVVCVVPGPVEELII